MKSKVPLGFILLDNQIIINYVTNRTYILQASKRRQIQVNCLLNLRYEFKYPMTDNINKYDGILLYTFNAQAVNHLSQYTGFRLPPLINYMLSTFCYIYIIYIFFIQRKEIKFTNLKVISHIFHCFMFNNFQLF